ncbi:uncharacterized protein LOC129804631 isoform X4 [Phlebotomus papatasi]|uniref:uncharacterized protein LOC129804631 isoform X4 n=1 Tax=Phlebotomus papatasi TaxID=29031 RepID=UPI0024841D49|nr:uncharacterized protein LOC129804631 isoform X4 [Phlebotomus papatasi]
MTTDSLKSFITLPTATIYGRKRSENTKFILLWSFVLLFSIGISSYVIWSSIRMTELRDELHQVRDKLEDLRKRMGLDLLDDLHDFEEAHENPTHHQEAFLEDFDNSVDDFSDEYGFEDDDEDDTEISREGSGIFKMFPFSDDITFPPVDEYDDESIYDEIRKRVDGRRPHNGVHRRHPRRYQSFSAAPTQFVDKDVTLTIRESDSKQQNGLHIRHRNQQPSMHPNAQPSIQANLQEHRAAPEQFVTQKQINLRRFANSGEQKHLARTIAIHYVGDEDKYHIRAPHHSRVNGRLRHHDKVYTYWKPANWAANAGMEHFFTMDNGVVTVKEGGLYLIYAQIYYDDVPDRNSFLVQHNGQTFLHCERMTYSDREVNKTNTCYTSGVAVLRPNDQIVVKDTEHHRFVLFHPYTSFFGLVKLGDLRNGFGSSEENLVQH